ncbi:MAG TPA: type IV secretory system conjugative DNA transfer family protein [Bacteroidia bacterium]|jgi:type IV secretion system protein VirD4|nr:type IV secretory system conjugative DNA transfer family protein [Bacteroidia bacterium]
MSFIESLFDLIVGILGGIIKFLFEFIGEIITGIPKRKKEHSAHFSPAWELMSFSQKGFCLNGKSCISVKTSYTGALIVGGTGAGKSSTVIIPTIFKTTGTKIINDPSSELYIRTSSALRHYKNYDIKRLNFADPSVSSAYNPLTRANTSSEIQKVSSLLVSNSLGNNPKDPFWNTQSVAAIAMAITLLKRIGKKEYINLYNVRNLLNQMGGSAEKVDALFSKFADEVLFNEYKSFLSYDPKLVSNIIATCKAALQIFSDEAVARVTSYDDINMEDFRKKPTALYINNSISESRYYAIITSLFMEQLFSYILSRFPAKGEQDIFFLIDEMGSLRLPTLPLIAANIRKHSGGIMALVQDYSAVIHNFGAYEAATIKANLNAKLFFTGASNEVSTEISKTLGRYQYEDGKGRTIIRDLMTPDEVRMLNPHRGILIMGHHAPVYARLHPYYKNAKQRRWSEMPPVKLGSKIPETVPLLDLDNLDA